MSSQTSGDGNGGSCGNGRPRPRWRERQATAAGAEGRPTPRLRDRPQALSPGGSKLGPGTASKRSPRPGSGGGPSTPRNPTLDNMDTHIALDNSRIANAMPSRANLSDLKRRINEGIRCQTCQTCLGCEAYGQVFWAWRTSLLRGRSFPCGEVAEWQAQASFFLGISVWTYLATWAYFRVTRKVIKRGKQTGDSLNP